MNNSKNNIPYYAKKGDAGMDLRADFSKGVPEKFLINSILVHDEFVLIEPKGRALIPTNNHVAIPEGYELQIRPRSGLALKHGITVLNTPGTIDSGYRNSIGVILINNDPEIPFKVEQGDRIAQAILNKFETIEWKIVDNLDETERGQTGFGDSGLK